MSWLESSATERVNMKKSQDKTKAINNWRQKRADRIDKELKLRLENRNLVMQWSTWLAVSEPTDKFCYFQGESVGDREVGKMAWQAYEHGHVMLFQKKLKDGYFEYWAKRTNKR